jgi:hypothetical protein
LAIPNTKKLNKEHQNSGEKTNPVVTSDIFRPPNKLQQMVVPTVGSVISHKPRLFLLCDQKKKIDLRLPWKDVWITLR